MAPLEAGQVNREGDENADMKCDPEPNARGHGGNRFTLREGPQSETPKAPPIFSRAPERGAYGERPRMDAAVEELVEAGKRTTEAAEQLEQLRPGAVCR